MTPPVPLTVGAFASPENEVSPDLGSYCASVVSEVVGGSVRTSMGCEIRRLADNALVFSVAGYGIPEYSIDGSKIFALSDDGTTVGSFDARSGHQLGRVVLGVKMPYARFAETSRGRVVAFDNYVFRVDGRRVAWDGAGRPDRAILACSGDIVAHADAITLGVRFSDVESGTAIWDAPLPRATISGDGRALFAYSDLEVVVRSAGATRTISAPAIAHRRLVVSRDGTKMVAFGVRKATMIDVESGAVEWTVDGPKDARFSGDGTRVVLMGIRVDFAEGGSVSYYWEIYDATTSTERVRTALESGSGRSIPTELGESIRRFVS